MTIKTDFNQEHFEILEVDIPIFTNSEACTYKGGQGGFTPLTCDQQWGNNYKTIKFTNDNAPYLYGESGIYRVITSITENKAELKPGDGLASRSSASIILNDFIGDSREEINSIPQSVKDNGTYFGKLNAGQILTNKKARIKTYSVGLDGVINLSLPVSTRYYVVDTFKSSRNNKWIISLKDEMSLLNITEKTWPINLSKSYLTLDIDATQTVIDVAPNSLFNIGDVIIIDDEFMEITNFDGTLNKITVKPRGVKIVAPISLKTLTETNGKTHSALSDIVTCKIFDNATISDLLYSIITDIGIDPILINKVDWDNEVNTWHSATRINTIFFEIDDATKIVKKILTDFLLDMWSDNEKRKIYLSAISVWKQSSIKLNEGVEIDFDSVRIGIDDEIRATKAMVLFNKPYLSKNNDNVSYSNSSIYERTDLNVPEIFGKSKDKIFDPSVFLDNSSANLLLQRYVERFKFPAKVYNWVTQERKLNFNIGDVVDINVNSTQNFLGDSSVTERAQITSIKTKYINSGREYNVKALTYEVASLSGSEIVINGNNGSPTINLWDLSGQPAEAVTLYFIFNGAIAKNFGSGDNLTSSIVSGNFKLGSKLIFILINGAELHSKGGDGGNGEYLEYINNTNTWVTTLAPSNGVDGGIVYDARGIDTDIYLTGATGNANYPTANGYIKAPSGGDGGFNGSYIIGQANSGIGGDGGNGGDGVKVGLGGKAGLALSLPASDYGIKGVDGKSDLTGNGFGLPGVPNNATLGGLAGKGIVDNGTGAHGGNIPLINIITALPTDLPIRYINGNGDHP